MVGPLHEREREYDVIVGALDGVAAGRGRALVVEGPAGIGKTSLLGLAREAALARELAVASARGSELETAYAWGVVHQLPGGPRSEVREAEREPGARVVRTAHATGRTLRSHDPWSNTAASASATRALRIGSHVEHRNATRSSSLAILTGGLPFALASSASICGSSASASSVNWRQ